jgi:hypothetical protein
MPTRSLKPHRRAFRFQIMNRLTREGGSAQEWDEILTPLIKAGFREQMTPL